MQSVGRRNIPLEFWFSCAGHMSNKVVRLGNISQWSRLFASIKIVKLTIHNWNYLKSSYGKFGTYLISLCISDVSNKICPLSFVWKEIWIQILHLKPHDHHTGYLVKSPIYLILPYLGENITWNYIIITISLVIMENKYSGTIPFGENENIYL